MRSIIIYDTTLCSDSYPSEGTNFRTILISSYVLLPEDAGQWNSSAHSAN